MARKKVEAPQPDIADLLPPVKHLPVRSLPFNAGWRKAARSRMLELKPQGIGQREFAAWCGCAQGSVSNVLGEDEPTFWRCDYLERFSHALGVPLPLRARLDMLGEELDDDDPGLAKVLDLVDVMRSKRK